MRKKIASILRHRKQCLATAESCTGGLLGKQITDLPGSSDYYVGGIIAYNNTVKETLLGVPREVLERHGAVSREVAEAMAEGVIEHLGADMGVSTTGIAGPLGGTEENPVGTVWMSVRYQGKVMSELLVLSGTRKEVRKKATKHALRLILRMLLEKTFPTSENDTDDVCPKPALGDNLQDESL